MTDPVQELYETRAYPAMSHPPADPALSGVAALLGGLGVRHPAEARILEIGCASGHHLIPLAMRWPGSRFTGIDLSGPAIRQARGLAAAAGVANVEFHTADLREFRDADEPYDFIMAHGFFSWVPDEVKAALFAFLRRNLSVGGLATVSFNLESGWRQRLPVIEKVRAIQQAGAADEMAALAILRTVTGPGSAEMAVIDDMLAKGPEILPFDDFAPVNDPWPLERFVRVASEAGLRWLGASDPGMNAAADAGRTFYSAAMCCDDEPLEPRVSWEVLQWIAVRAGASEVGGNDPLLRAVAAAGPGGIAVRDLAARLPEMQHRDLGRGILEAIQQGRILPRMDVVDYDPEPPERPMLDKFRLECARRGLPLVDVWHRPCGFPGPHYEVLARMDGTRDQVALEAFAKSHCPELDFRPWLRHLAGRGMFA